MTKDRFRFRAWKKAENIYWYNAQKSILFSEILEDEKYIIEQCTGLKDANKDLLYEGDIVNILCEVDEIGVIEWSDVEAQFVVRCEQAGFVANFDNYRGTDLEIIGNIHENPELLEVNNGK